GTVGTLPTGFNQNFSNLTFNAPNISTGRNLAGALTTVNGTLSVVNTGSGTVRLNYSADDGANPANYTANIANISISGGTLAILGGSNGTATTNVNAVVNVSGNITLSGSGILDMNFTNGNASSAATINLLGNINMSSSSKIQRTVATTATINFAKSSGTQTFSQTGTSTTSNSINWNVGTVSPSTSPTLQLLSDATIGGAATFAVNNGSSLDCQTFVLSNTSTAVFTLNSGTTLYSANTNSTGGVTGTGTNGSIQFAGTRNYNGTVVYNANVAQTVGAANYNNLTIANSAGVSLGSNNNVTVNGTLTLTNGIVTTSSSSLLTIASTGSIASASSSSYVSGPLARVITTANYSGGISYPIGKGGNYRPVTFTYAADPTSKTVTIEQFESIYPGTIPSTATVSRFGSRYRTITQSATGTAYTVGLNDGGVSPTGTVVMLRREGTGSTTSNSTSFGSSTYTNTSSFSTTNVANDIALAEAAIPLTVSGFTASNKVYNGLNTATITAGTLVTTNVAGADVVSLSSASGTFSNATVGNGKTVTGTYTLTGANAGAYSLTQPTTTADITPRGLTITGLTGDNKAYDGLTTATASGTAAYSGLQNGESFSVTGTPSYAFVTATVGTGKAITTTGYTAPSSNYSITQPSLTANITPVTLSVTANPQTVCYGTAASTVTGAGSLTGITGYVNSENSSVITGSVTSYSTTYTNTTAAGTGGVTVTPIVTGLSATNYVFTPVAGTVSIDATSNAGTVASAQAICTGSTPADLTLSGHTGSVSKWQYASDAGFTSPTDISNTTTTLSGASVSNTTSRYYRAVVTSGVCAAANATGVLVTVNPNGTWIGGTSSSFSNAANWCGGVPSGGANIVIPSGAPNNVTLSGNFTAGNVTMNDTLFLNGNALTVTGTLSGTPVLSGTTTSSFTYSGSSSATINFNQGTDGSVLNPTTGTNCVKDLTVSGGGALTIGSKLNVFDGLNVTSGTLNTGGNIVLRSTSSNTSYVGTVGK
ncbi:MAG: YDG domain-containing protein, partial [Bacteroidetes bacterium]|nr:YDG domain-containing protein [Bacteroidota bacterium]